MADVRNKMYFVFYDREGACPGEPPNPYFRWASLLRRTGDFVHGRNARARP